MNIIYFCCIITGLPFIIPFIIFTSWLWLPIVFLVILYDLIYHYFSNNTSSSNNNTSEDILLNNTLEDTPLTSEIPPIPPCFEGLEEQWADLNKNGRDFRKEIWFRTHIILSSKEKITPLNHLANFFRRTLREESLDDSHEDLQEENLDNGDFNYQESESCTLTDETSSDEDLVDD